MISRWYSIIFVVLSIGLCIYSLHEVRVNPELAQFQYQTMKFYCAQLPAPPKTFTDKLFLDPLIAQSIDMCGLYGFEVNK